MRTTPVAYVSKKPPDTIEPWRYFGADREAYERWAPHICGICCLKMVGDTLGRTSDISLHQLTQLCVRRGGFRVIDDDRIEGVFHRPLAELGNDLGIPCRVAPGLTVEQAAEVVTRSGFAIMSVDLAKVDGPHCGGHLLLIHDYVPETGEFVLHDCSSVIGRPGRDVRIERDALALISNNKGLTIKPT